MYAIIQTGGKQYRVQPGDVVDVEKLEAEPASIVELDQVLLVADDGALQIGTPTVPGAKVVATVEAQHRGDKVMVYKFKPKVRYRRKKGHRQNYTRLAVQEIVTAQ